MTGSVTLNRNATHPSVHRHTSGLDTAPDPDPWPGIPAQPDQLPVDDARELSDVLFARLKELKEGTSEYSYVRNTLVELNLALVRFAARRFRARSESQDDVVQVGAIGLIKAINRFDPARGVVFSTFALPTILGEIKRHFRDNSWDVHVPRRLQELRTELSRAADELEQDLGRPPTLDELAARLGRPAEEVRDGLVAANGYTAASLDFHTADDEADSSFAERIGFEDDGLRKVEECQALRPLLAELPERDRKIISMRFGAEMTQSEIGAELGLSQMHVSRLLARILVRLRTGLARNPLTGQATATGGALPGKQQAERSRGAARAASPSLRVEASPHRP
ncbi:SigB/SigF/SigG family RNA polymerase sigma factor [Streptomyces jeddahensis]|uniref:RNA polymerase sigma factor SigF n=1 Tax=Streptomyces jeddahensis TaxID=1716141 RepID=A0A177HR69_9ACTN|nr:SigB/SigF/SigG family RNA polymerase sigma factor [Streptomyces jeddahensis]OAH13089.1 RNA polymerase sigma factor SigF [Streptomyces jeddahensis]